MKQDQPEPLYYNHLQLSKQNLTGAKNVGENMINRNIFAIMYLDWPI